MIGRDMPTGSVKWFNPTKGYGFIAPDEGSQDAFVHISAVEKAGLDTLREGQKVEYELVPGNNGKSSAENLVVVDWRWLFMATSGDRPEVATEKIARVYQKGEHGPQD